jgi:hypothetical protein
MAETAEEHSSLATKREIIKLAWLLFRLQAMLY